MLKGKIIKIVETPDIHWVKYICRGEDNTNFECKEKRLLQAGKGRKRGEKAISVCWLNAHHELTPAWLKPAANRLGKKQVSQFLRHS